MTTAEKIAERMEKARRNSLLALHAPDACKFYRSLNKIAQWKLARCFGVDVSVISRIEKGHVGSFRVAEGILILAGEDLAKIGIVETPGLRDLLDRFKRHDIPCNIETDEVLEGTT